MKASNPTPTKAPRAGRRQSILMLALTGLVLGLIDPGADTLAQNVTLVPNDFTGVIRFTNTNPAVVTILNNTLKMNGANINAFTTAPPDFPASAGTVGFPQEDPTVGRPYSLTVESDGGAGGVSYNVHVNATYGASAPEFNFYNFATKTGSVAPPDTAGPTTLNFEECVGIVQLQFGDSCGVPVSVNSGRLSSDSSTTFFTGPVSLINHITKPGMQTYTLNYTQGTDVFSDTVTNEVQFTVTASCDVVTLKCFNSIPGTGGGGGGGTNLGEIIGKWDVVDEIEHPPAAGSSNFLSTFIQAFGPFANLRYDFLAGESLSPIITPNFMGIPNAPPQRSLRLEKLVPGPYSVRGQSSARLDRAYSFISPNSVQADAVAGPPTDLFDTFVMRPAFFFGDVLLSDPFNGTQPSGLSYLYFADADDVAGVPKDVGITSGSHLGISSSQGSFSRTMWPFSVGTGDSFFGQTLPTEFRSKYEMPVVQANNVAGQWSPASMQLVFRSTPPLSNGSPPLTNGFLNIQEPISTTALLNPGVRRQQDFKYCFGRVTLNYSTTAGTFYDPQAFPSGAFSGTDFLGRPNVNYTAGASFVGLPQGFDSKAATGQVAMTLPQGTYTLSPRVQAVNAAGNVSTTQFTQTSLTLGCGQASEGPPGLSVSVDSLGECVTTNQLTVKGKVNSGTPPNADPVSRVWYTLNGGTQIDVCSANCDPNHIFTFNVTLALCQNTLKVFAMSPQGTASTTDTIIYDDPNDNVACEGGCAPPPVEICGDGIDNDADSLVDEDCPFLNISDNKVIERHTGLAPATPVTLMVTLSAPVTQTVKVDYMTMPGTATGGNVDYVNKSGSLSFAPGEVKKTLSFQVNGDRIDEPNETFRVMLKNPVNAGISDGLGNILIKDDDRNGAFSCYASAVRVNFTAPSSLGLFAEPINANEPVKPCADDFDQASSFAPTPALVRAEVLTAQTDSTPNVPSMVSAKAGDMSTSRGEVARATINLGPLSLAIQVAATGLKANAKVNCPVLGGQPVLTGSSTVASAAINGVPIANVTGPVSIPILGVAVLHLNHQSVVAVPGGKVLTQRALWLQVLKPTPVAPGEIILGEAVADYHGNPCAN